MVRLLKVRVPLLIKAEAALDIVMVPPEGAKVTPEFKVSDPETL